MSDGQFSGDLFPQFRRFFGLFGKATQIVMVAVPNQKRFFELHPPVYAHSPARVNFVQENLSKSVDFAPFRSYACSMNKNPAKPTKIPSLSQTDGTISIEESKKWFLSHLTMRRDRSLFARLLAAENLVVEVNPRASTASFAPDTRRLTLPMWSGISDDMNDMLTAHEVGHALYTPRVRQIEDAVQLIDANPEAKSIVWSYLNIVEDARIEKKIQTKYPGLRGAFFRAYSDIHKMDIMGVRANPNKERPTIDRLNISAKLGFYCNHPVEFNEIEEDFRVRMMQTNTWEQVVALAKEIYDYAKQQNQHEPETGDEGLKETMEGEGEEGGGQESEDQKPGDGKIDQSRKGSQDQGFRPQPKQKGTGTGGMAPENIPCASETEQRLKQAVASIPKEQRFDVSYADLPVSIDLSKVVVPYKKVLEDWRASGLSRAVMNPEVLKFRHDNLPVLGAMANEFEMRKAADLHLRTQQYDAGTINTRRLPYYRISDDIFNKNTVVKQGKNHGIIMIIDWSGSMSDVLSNTVKQVLNLVLFCRKIHIPFEVYAFSDQGSCTEDVVLRPKSADLRLVPHKLIQFLSDQMKTDEINEAIEILTAIALTSASGGDAFTSKLKSAGWKGTPNGYGLGGTPLDSSVITSSAVIQRFRQRTGRQIVNYICLTDGQDNGGLCRRDNARFPENGIMVIRDRISGVQLTTVSGNYDSRATNTLAQLVKARTGANMVGYYLSNSESAVAYLSNFKENTPELKALQTSYKEKKFAEIQTAGWDSFFVVPVEDTKVNNTIKTGSAQAAGAQFAQICNDKKTNRILLGRFLDKLSKESAFNKKNV
jgi:hypothetical protein